MEHDLGYRKVQRTGRGSYITSLPKEWVQTLGLHRGSEIAFKVTDESALLLVPRTIMEGRKEDAAKEHLLSLSQTEDPRSVCRKIVSLYVVSAHLIHIRVKEGNIDPKLRDAINNTVRNTLLGSEIIEETANQITIQVLINHPDFSIEQALRRMALLALSANRDALLALKELDHDRVSSVLTAHADVNRLNLYVIRQLKYGLEQNLFKNWGFKTPKEFLGYRIVANDIKNIADNARSISTNLMTLKRLIDDKLLFLKKFDDELFTQIEDFNSQAHQLFEASLSALIKRDYASADKTISTLESFLPLEGDLVTLMASKKLDPNVSSILRLILDSSRRILDYSRNIAEVTLNRTVEEISSFPPIK